MRVAGLVALVLAVTSVSARAGGNAIGWPPAKVDVGYLTFATGDGIYSGGQVLVGLNWATIYPRRTWFDIGLGYVGAWMDDPFPRLQPSPKVDAGPPTMRLHGGYLELAGRVASGKWWRTWLSGRGELSSFDGAPSLGAAARVSTELWGGVLEGGRNGVLVGVFAFGVWVEASARELGKRDVMVTAASAGLSVRVPLLAIGD